MNTTTGNLSILDSIEAQGRKDLLLSYSLSDFKVNRLEHQEPGDHQSDNDAPLTENQKAKLSPFELRQRNRGLMGLVSW